MYWSWQVQEKVASDGFVAHFPFPEHSKSFEWLSPGTQLLAFTTSVKRKATMDLATESFTKPMKWLGPKASISSSRTRPPGAWRGVTLRPSMREHC